MNSGGKGEILHPKIPKHIIKHSDIPVPCDRHYYTAFQGR